MIAYEVGKGTVSKQKADKFLKHFATKIVKNLENNSIKVCDPSKEESKYRKLDYKLPKDVWKYIDETRSI